MLNSSIQGKLFLLLNTFANELLLF